MGALPANCMGAATLALAGADMLRVWFSGALQRELWRHEPFSDFSRFSLKFKVFNSTQKFNQNIINYVFENFFFKFRFNSTRKSSGRSQTNHFLADDASLHLPSLQDSPLLYPVDSPECLPR
jgi:hypothetical protein